MHRCTHTAILVLAAGESSRMGSTKQLLPWKDTTLLGNAVKTALAVSTNVWIILGARAEKIKKEIAEEDVVVCEHSEWQQGLGSSLAFGVEQLMKSEKTFESLIVTLADQPLIDADYLKKIYDAYEQNTQGIVATAYGDRAGVPAVFNQRYFNKLAELTGDTGAKAIIESHMNDTFVVSADGNTIDLDTVTDYEKIRNTTK